MGKVEVSFTRGAPQGTTYIYPAWTIVDEFGRDRGRFDSEEEAIKEANILDDEALEKGAKSKEDMIETLKEQISRRNRQIRDLRRELRKRS